MYELVVVVTVWSRGAGGRAPYDGKPPIAETRFVRPLSVFWTDAEVAYWQADLRVLIECWLLGHQVTLRDSVVCVVYAVEEVTFEVPDYRPA